jgi:hypothetical protein
MVKKILKNVKKSIRTVRGLASYVGTEVEDKFGRWNQDYFTRDGFWLIHEGKKHHIYQVI